MLTVGRAYKHYSRAVQQVAALSGHVSESTIAACLGETRKFVRYWAQKAEDPTFHPGTVGGARHTLFTEEGQHLVDAMLFNELRRNPRWPCREFAALLNGRGMPVDARSETVSRVLSHLADCLIDGRWVSRAFQRMGFTSEIQKCHEVQPAQCRLHCSIYFGSPGIQLDEA